MHILQKSPLASAAPFSPPLSGFLTGRLFACNGRAHAATGTRGSVACRSRPAGDGIDPPATLGTLPLGGPFKVAASFHFRDIAARAPPRSRDRLAMRCATLRYPSVSAASQGEGVAGLFFREPTVCDAARTSFLQNEQRHAVHMRLSCRLQEAGTTILERRRRPPFGPSNSHQTERSWAGSVCDKPNRLAVYRNHKDPDRRPTFQNRILCTHSRVIGGVFVCQKVCPDDGLPSPSPGLRSVGGHPVFRPSFLRPVTSSARPKVGTPVPTRMARACRKRAEVVVGLLAGGLEPSPAYLRDRVRASPACLPTYLYE